MTGQETRQPHRVYKGWRPAKGAGPVTVYAIDDSNSQNAFPLDPGPSQKIRNHSLDGFQWGYGGSGPAQLALALLLDATGNPHMAERLHQAFKGEFVAVWGDHWEITRDAVRSWVVMQGAA